MNALAFVGGVEVLLLVVIVAKIRQNAELLRRIRGCNEAFAHATALASQGRYSEAREAAQRWAGRMRAHMAGEPYRRPEPPQAAKDEWRSRFAP